MIGPAHIRLIKMAQQNVGGAHYLKWDDAYY